MTSKSAPSPLVAVPLRDQVHQRIRTAILAGEMRPGERISTDELARELGVSATPVRDALRSLADEGLVESSPRRWTRVASPSGALARETYPIIANLEALALTSMDPVSDDLVAALERANDDFRTGARANDFARCVRANDRFHEAIVEAAGNPTLVRVVSELRARVRLLDSQFFQFGTEESAREHDEAIAALRRGDPAKAAAVIQQQWVRALPQLGFATPAASEHADGD